MRDLTKKEILIELKRLGIHNKSELDDYMREYKSYLASLKDMIDRLEVVDTYPQDLER
jgi:hypothetical protein